MGTHSTSNLVFGLSKGCLYLGGFLMLKNALKNAVAQETYTEDNDSVDYDDLKQFQDQNNERLLYLMEQDKIKTKQNLEREYADGANLAQMNSEKSYNTVKLLVIKSQSAAENMIISRTQLPEEIVKDFLDRLEYDGIVSTEYHNTNIREVLVDRFGQFRS